MLRIGLLLVAGLAVAAADSALAQTALSPRPPAADTVSPDATARIVSQLIAEAIPREYDRTKDWGRTKKITTGLRSSGNFFKFDVHRTKTVVNHGVWKHYRASMIEPEKNLLVRVDNLRSLAPA